MNNKKKIIILIGIVVLVLLLAAGVVYALNGQTRKYNRQLIVARELLEQGEYDRAIAAFAVAIAIDPNNFEAYGGKAEAVACKAGLEESTDNQLEGLLKAYLLYQDAMDVLESAGGIASTSRDNAKNLTDKQLEIQSRLENAVKDYVDELVTELNIEKIKELKEQYGEYVNVDFDAAIQKVEKKIQEEEARIREEEARREEEGKLESFLKKIYEALSSGNYTVAQELYVSSECDEYREKITGCEARVFEGDGKAGKGAGFYHDGPYTDGPLTLFYYGDVVDGVCQGEGVWFWGYVDSNSVTLYEGEFSNNMPNGEIYYSQKSDTMMTDRYKHGNMVDGLWEGNVELTEHTKSTNYTSYFDHSEFMHGVPINQKGVGKFSSPDVVIYWRIDHNSFGDTYVGHGYTKQQMKDNFGITDISDLSQLRSGALAGREE